MSDFSQVRIAITPQGRKFISETSYLQKITLRLSSERWEHIHKWLPHVLAGASIIISILSWYDAHKAKEQIIKLKIELQRVKAQ